MIYLRSRVSLRR